MIDDDRTLRRLAFRTLSNRRSVRHNPYIGSIQPVRSVLERHDSSGLSSSPPCHDQSLQLPKSNAYIGLMRHSPAVTEGLMDFVWEPCPKPWQMPLLSQIDISFKHQLHQNHVDKSRLDDLPACTPSSILSHPAFTTTPTQVCAICLGEVTKTDVIRVLPMCGHYFHQKCVDDWLTGRRTDAHVDTNKCPVCKQVVLNSSPSSPVCPSRLFSPAAAFTRPTSRGGMSPSCASVTSESDAIPPSSFIDVGAYLFDSSDEEYSNMP